MDDILREIAGHGFHRALIRLWLLAESTSDDAQTLSRWLHGCELATTRAIGEQFAAVLDGDDPVPPLNAGDHPLSLILALDTFLGQRADLPAAPPVLKANGRLHWLIRRRNRGETPADRQSPNLEQWFRHFRVIPDRIEVGGAWIDVALRTLPNLRHRPKSAADPVRLRVSHFTDAAGLVLQEDVANERFHVTGIGDEAARRASLESDLAAAREHCAEIWLAPELSVTPTLRRKVAALLLDEGAEHLLLCVPGSFHEMDGADRVNRAEILDGDGVPIATQHKLSQYSDSSRTPVLHEHIVTGRKITLLSTSIGLVGVAICKDFCDAMASALIQCAWERLAPDWLLVPSMGGDETLRAHESRAHTHWSLRRTRCIIANQERPTSDAPTPGFVYGDGATTPVAAGGSCHPPSNPNGAPPPSAEVIPLFT